MTMKMTRFIVLALFAQQLSTAQAQQEAKSTAKVQVLEIKPDKNGNNTQSFSFSFSGDDHAIVSGSTTVQTESVVTMKDDSGSITAKATDVPGAKEVLIKDTNDDVVFEGSISKDEIDQVPEEFREMAKSIFGNNTFDIQVVNGHNIDSLPNTLPPDLSETIAELLKGATTNGFHGTTITNISDIASALSPAIESAVAEALKAALAGGGNATVLSGAASPDMEKKIAELMAAAQQTDDTDIDPAGAQVGAMSMIINAGSFSTSGGGLQQVSATYSMTTKDGTITVKPNDEEGVKDVLIKDTDGKIVFEEAITKDDIDQVPEAYRETTKGMLEGNMFNIQINGSGNSISVKGDAAAQADAPKAEKDISDLLKDAE